MSELRKCSRPGCQNPAVATLTYQYERATAVIGPLSPRPVPGAFDLCAEHVHTVTAPRGWEMVRLQTSFEEAPPSESDLMALADAIRETAKRPVAPPEPARREIRRPTDFPEPRPRRAKLSLVPDGGEDDEVRDAAAPAGLEGSPSNGGARPGGARSTARSSAEDSRGASVKKTGEGGKSGEAGSGTASGRGEGGVDLTDAGHLLED